MKDFETIRDIMTTDLKVVKLNTPFSQIKKLFDLGGFNHLPVVDDMVMIKGIISKKDFTNLAFQLSKNTSGKTYSDKWLTSLKAKDIMTAKPVYLNPDDSIQLAADLFLENTYHAVPVLEDGVLVGIVTSHDLLAHAYYKEPVGRTSKRKVEGED